MLSTGSCYCCTCFPGSVCTSVIVRLVVEAALECTVLIRPMGRVCQKVAAKVGSDG